MKKEISKNSPKNKFRASINYEQPLSEIGSSSTAKGMTLDEVKHNALFYTEQAKRNGVNSKVEIFENKKEYPEFDWQFIERYWADGRKNNGGAGRGQGRKSQFNEETKGVKFMCPISKEAELKKYVNRKLLEWSRSGI